MHLGRGRGSETAVQHQLNSATVFPPGVEGARGTIENPLKKYLPLSKACKKGLNKFTSACRNRRKYFIS